MTSRYPSPSSSDREPGRIAEVLRVASIAGIAARIGITIFHGAIVIPTAHEVMGSHREIGFVTRRVTGPLNTLGCIVTAILVLECIVSRRRRSRRKRIALFLSGGFILAAQVTLVVLRTVLDGYLDPEALAVSDPDRFGFIHERYLNVTTILVVVAIAHALMLLWPHEAPREAG